MATCGPSNPAQNLKSFAERDSSLHTEKYQPVVPSVRGIRSNGAPSAQYQQQQFNQFAQSNPTQYFQDINNTFNGPNLFPPNFNSRSAPNMPASQAPPSVGFANPARAQTAEADWAAQFQQLSLEDQRQRGQFHQSSYHHTSGPEFHQHVHFQPHFVPQIVHQQPQHFQHQLQNQHQHQASKPIASEDAFNAAFAEAEMNFSRMQQRAQAVERQISPEVKEKSQDNRQGEDASEVASKIINSLHEKTPGQQDLSAKLQNSKFMNLMTKLSTNEIMLGEKDLLNASDNAKVEPFDLHQDVPFRPEHSDTSQSQDAESKQEAPTIGLNKVKESLSNDWAPQRPITRPLAPVDRLPTLDDPETYIFKMKQNLDPRLFKKSEYTSPFASAREHAMPSLQQQSWEEDYSEW